MNGTADATSQTPWCGPPVPRLLTLGAVPNPWTGPTPDADPVAITPNAGEQGKPAGMATITGWPLTLPRPGNGTPTRPAPPQPRHPPSPTGPNNHQGGPRTTHPSPEPARIPRPRSRCCDRRGHPRVGLGHRCLGGYRDHVLGRAAVSADRSRACRPAARRGPMTRHRSRRRQLRRRPEPPQATRPGTRAAVVQKHPTAVVKHPGCPSRSHARASSAAPLIAILRSDMRAQRCQPAQ